MEYSIVQRIIFNVKIENSNQPLQMNRLDVITNRNNEAIKVYKVRPLFIIEVNVR